MRNWVIGIALGIVSLQGWSRDYSIILVQRELDLGLGQAPKQDFYLNMGAMHGLTVGATVAVNRRMPVIDHYNGKNTNDVLLPVGYLKIIHIEKDLSVARYQAGITADDPGLTIDGPLVGDVVELVDGVPQRTPSSSVRRNRRASAK